MGALHPTAEAVRVRFQKLIDQGRVCPACGGELEVVIVTKDGMYEGEPCVSLDCKRNKQGTKVACWSHDTLDEEQAITDPEGEGYWLGYVEDELIPNRHKEGYVKDD